MVRRRESPRYKVVSVLYLQLLLLLPCYGFRLPPGARISLGREESLKSDCLQSGTVPPQEQQWERDVQQGYQLVTCLLGELLKAKQESELWFPRWDEQDNSSDVLERIVTILSRHSNMLVGEQQQLTWKYTTWPETPATRVYIQWKSDEESDATESSLSSSGAANALAATEEWVEQTLCRLRLCPHVATMERGATGLGAAGVSEGPIGIRLVQSDDETTKTRKATNACRLAASVWDGITELAERPESEVSTLLIVASEYDSKFTEFVEVCDELIQPCIEITGADSIVGRAWFHPMYDTSAVPQQQNSNNDNVILPGHALPPKMVKGFLEKYLSEEEDIPATSRQTYLDRSNIATANNAVRHTPHATVNLLRRSQLTAAKQVEAKAGNKRPNAIYARNVIRILEDWDDSK